MNGPEKSLYDELSETYVPYDDITDYSEHLENLRKVAYRLLTISGVEDESIFRDVTYDVPLPLSQESGWTEIDVDLVTADSLSSAPHVAIYVTLDSEQAATSNYGGGLDYESQLILGTCRSSTGANVTVVLSNEYIIVSSAPTGDTTSWDQTIYSLNELDESYCKELSNHLSPPDSYPSKEPGPHPSTKRQWESLNLPGTDWTSNQIATKYFELNVERYRRELNNVQSAKSSLEKGDSLETLTDTLFSGLEMIEVRERNLRTKTGEIDLVLEHIGFDSKTLFDSYTRFILVECKNWSDNTPSEEIRKFQNKMREVGVNLGFFVTTSRLTGYQSETDATRLVNKQWNSPRIVTISSDELAQVSSGKSFYEIIDRKLFNQRFDTH